MRYRGVLVDPIGGLYGGSIEAQKELKRSYCGDIKFNPKRTSTFPWLWKHNESKLNTVDYNGLGLCYNATRRGWKGGRVEGWVARCGVV